MEIPRPRSVSEEPEWDWRLVRARCLREARRVLRDREDAEEAVQEAMARAWGRRRTCASPEAPLAWLLQITHREALRILERRTRRAAREVMTPVAPERRVADDPFEALLARLDTRRALAGLRADERALLHLRYRHDLTQAEVARRLDLPEGTVKVRLHRIRQRLRNGWPDDIETTRRDPR
jgi:RNA polymerase sigma-70 factor, ECF subfamily